MDQDIVLMSDNSSVVVYIGKQGWGDYIQIFVSVDTRDLPSGWRHTVSVSL